eukprot:2337724-Prymnesium_polylepis.1
MIAPSVRSETCHTGGGTPVVECQRGATPAVTVSDSPAAHALLVERGEERDVRDDLEGGELEGEVIGEAIDAADGRVGRGGRLEDEGDLREREGRGG